MVQRHGGHDEVERAGGEGVLREIGVPGFDVRAPAGPGFLGEDGEHAGGGIDGEHAADARGEGQGQQAGAGAVVEGGHFRAQRHGAIQRGEDVRGKFHAAGVFVPGLGAGIEGGRHRVFRE